MPPESSIVNAASPRERAKDAFMFENMSA